MRHYEVTFIVDPLLSGDDVKATAQRYVDFLVAAGYTITHVTETGLRQLAYSINKRQSGYYYTIEFAGADGSVVDKLELNMRRDETLMRFLTVALDQFGVQYNEDKRTGKVGNRRKAAIAAAAAAKAEEADVAVEEA